MSTPTHCAITRQIDRSAVLFDHAAALAEHCDERALALARRYRREDLAGHDSMLAEALGEQLRSADMRRELASAYHGGDWGRFGRLLASAVADYIETRTRELAQAELQGETLSGHARCPANATMPGSQYMRSRHDV